MSRIQILSQLLFLTQLILHTFAGYAFCHLLYLQFRQYRLGKPVWGGWTWRALTLVFAAHYFNEMWIYLSFTFSDGAAAQVLDPINVVHVITRPLVGPLLLQLFYLTERSRPARALAMAGNRADSMGAGGSDSRAIAAAMLPTRRRRAAFDGSGVHIRP